MSVLAARHACAWLTLCALHSACISAPRPDIDLARARVTADYASYTLDRVGLLPMRYGGRGERLDPEQARALQAALAQAFARDARFEVVALGAQDIEEVPPSEPVRRGWTPPATVLALGKRYDLDGLLVATVTEQQCFAPLKLALEIDLVAAETGLPIWSASIALDGGNERVRAAIEAWHREERDRSAGGESWELALISPRRFAEFAAERVAAALPPARD